MSVDIQENKIIKSLENLLVYEPRFDNMRVKALKAMTGTLMNHKLHSEFVFSSLLAWLQQAADIEDG